MTIPKLTPYTGQVANPDGSQTQTEFTQNMFDQLSYEAQLATQLDATIDGMNNAVDEVETNAVSAQNSANAAEAAASSAGYQGLWPDTGGSALKGETWQTQVGGTPTGEYYTALQNTTVDPVGDNVNWKELKCQATLAFDGVDAMIDGGDAITWGVSTAGVLASSGGTTWKHNGGTTGTIADFDAVSLLFHDDFSSSQEAEDYVKNNPNEATSFIYSGHIVIGNKPLPFTASARDAFQVSRNIDGLTDCHAFADKTTILNATDAGTYGAVDVQTEIAGTHNQNHLYSFQDRSKFSGLGTLVDWGNIIWPEMPGNGVCRNRIDIQIKDVVTGVGAEIQNNIGVQVQNKVASVGDPISFNSTQDDNGFSFFGFGGGYAYNSNSLKIGGNSSLGATNYGRLVTIENPSTNERGAFHAEPGTGVSMIADGDINLSFAANGKIKGRFRTTTFQDAFTPGTDNLQPLGDIVTRWAQVFAGTGTINTSDENEKTELLVQSEQEKAAAIELKDALRKYKFKDAVNAKGEENARIHFGIGAQTAVAIMEKHGLNPFEYAFICFDEWDDMYETVQTNIGETIEVIEEFEVQATKPMEIEVVSHRTELVDGRYVRKPYTETVTVYEKVFEEFEVFNEDGSSAVDEDGNPIKHVSPIMEVKQRSHTKPAEPIYEQVLVKESGSRYGIRYDELLAFIIAAM